MTNAERPEKSKCNCCVCTKLNSAIDYFESDEYLQEAIDTGRVAVDEDKTADLILRKIGIPQKASAREIAEALAASPSVIKVKK